MRKVFSSGSDLSVIIPTLNESVRIGRLLANVALGYVREIIVADGGSVDTTVGQAAKAGVRICRGPAGRAKQMNHGAAAATGSVFLFLHADSRLPENFDRVIQRVLADEHVSAGAFSLGIDGLSSQIRLVEYWANLRSRYLGMPYGDQGLFVRAVDFNRIGGYPDMPIMEDFVIVRRLRKTGRIVTAPERIYTSARRWRRMGVLRTTLINQMIVAGYLTGVPAERLARWYRRSQGLGESDPPETPIGGD